MPKHHTSSHKHPPATLPGLQKPKRQPCPVFRSKAASVPTQTDMLTTPAKPRRSIRLLRVSRRALPSPSAVPEQWLQEAQLMQRQFAERPAPLQQLVAARLDEICADMDDIAEVPADLRPSEIAIATRLSAITFIAQEADFCDVHLMLCHRPKNTAAPAVDAYLKRLGEWREACQRRRSDHKSNTDCGNALALAKLHGETTNNESCMQKGRNSRLDAPTT